jgi:hypothetical protein
MADIVFAGGATAVLLYLMKTRPQDAKGVVKQAADNSETQGQVMMPNENYGGLNDVPAVEAQKLMMDAVATPLRPDGKYDYFQDGAFMKYMGTDKGHAEMELYLKKHGMTPYNEDEKRAGLLDMYYRQWLIKSMRAKTGHHLRKIQARNTLHQKQSTDQILNPQRNARWRDRGNSGPVLYGFLHEDSKITGQETVVDLSPNRFVIRPIEHSASTALNNYVYNDFTPTFVQDIPVSVMSNPVKYYNYKVRSRKMALGSIKGKEVIASA